MRGELAHLSQFGYMSVNDITAALEAAVQALVEVEANPPALPPAPPPSAAAPGNRAAAAPPIAQGEGEPMLEVPLKKGSRRVKQSWFVLPEGTDEAGYQQAAKIGGRLLDAKLWDGQSPLALADMHTVWRTLQRLDDKTLAALYTLDDFVHAGEAVSLTAL